MAYQVNRNYRVLFKTVMLNSGQFGPILPGALGNIWRHFWLSQVGMGVGITGIEWAEARDAAKHPTRHRKASSKIRIMQLKVSVVLQLKSPTL